VSRFGGARNVLWRRGVDDDESSTFVGGKGCSRMPVRVAVVDRVPMYARGLAATISEHGSQADIPADLLEWARRPGDIVVFLALSQDADWQVLAGLLEMRSDAVVVGIVAAAGVHETVRAVASGAAGIMARHAGPATVSGVLCAALDGQSMVPVEVLRTLVAGSTVTSDQRPVSSDEIGWLRRLADGVTVAQLAEQVGYSERMMFRLLAALYKRLGAGNRTKALMRARDEGWV
jgi:DNA-binding NarL/FixJ family response regulator